MKKLVKRWTALALSLVLAVGSMGQTALAASVLGTGLVSRTVELADGVFWTAQNLWADPQSDLRTENYITYTPSSEVTPVVYSGTYVASRNTVAAAAAALESQGYRVIAGINGGFFNGDGTPVGILMTGGVVRSLDLYNYALLGFTWDGQIFIDNSRITKTVSWETQGASGQYNLTGFNACRNNDDLGGLYLYNQDFSSRVSYDADRGCVAVVLVPVSGEESAGGEAQPPESGEEGTGGEAQPPEPGEEGTGGEAQPSESGEEGTGGDAQPPESGEEGTGGEAQPPESGEEGTGGEAQPPEPGEEGTGGEAQPPEPGEESTGGEAQPPEPGEESTGGEAQPPEFNKNVTMNGTLTLSVEAVMDTRAGDTFNGTLPEGRYMLYANYYNGNDALLNALRALTPGQRVTVTVSGVSEQWADAAYGITGLYTLLRDGKVVSDGLSTAANPYTAIGVKADGTAVFYTIDGRQSGYSIGASYAQIAQRLQELGCVNAVALDGGGSTTLGATLPGQERFELLNQPSQTGRVLSNSIFLVAGDGYTGIDPGFYLSSDTQVVLAGSKLNVSAVAYGQRSEAPDEPVLIPDWSATGGTVEGDGLSAVYTAGGTAGTYTVSAGYGSQLPVRVVDRLSSLWVTREGSSAAVDSLNLMPGGTVDLTAAGTWQHLTAAVGNGGVTWEADASIGSIDASGIFTAAGWNEEVHGTITAVAGGRTATVQVTVQAYPFTDLVGHWSANYVMRLYRLGLTQGILEPDGTYVYHPSSNLSRGELVVFIARLLHVDTEEYQDLELPFADADTIPEWMLPSVKAMYALRVLNGSNTDGILYANVGSSVSREEAMTLLGRVLADQMNQDLSGFSDSGLVSDWAQPYVETLVALSVVQGSGGELNPKSDITRGEAAKLLAEISGLEKADLTPRPSEPEMPEPETPAPDDSFPDSPD